MKRTHTCNELRLSDEGKEVSLIGWVDTLRDHGGVQFLDLRDREGITQVVFHPDNKELFEQAQKLRNESVVQVFGKVCAR